MTLTNQVPDVHQLTGKDFPNIAAVTAGLDYWQQQSREHLIWGYFCLRWLTRHDYL